MEYQSTSNRKSSSVSANRKATSRGRSQTTSNTSRPPSPVTQETDSTQKPSATRTDNRQTATQQIIAENVQFLIEQLEQGKSESLTAYLSAMANFHTYSFGNILQIAHFKPDATRVAGMYAWNQLGRSVKRGEKGIPIFAPMIGVSRKRSEDDEGEAAEREKSTLIGFRRVYVWDISQTEGAALPELDHDRVTGDVGGHRDKLITFINKQNIELEYSEKVAPALGVSYGGKIVVLPGQTPAEEFSVLVHELAHEMLHKAERRTITTQTVRETEAEAIAFVVNKAVGLNTGRASADYIHLYHGNAALLAESLSVIQRASAVILGVLLYEEQQPDPPAAPEQVEAAPSEELLAVA